MTKRLIHLSLILFIISLFLPAFTFGTSNVYEGYSALLLGPLGVLAYCFVWFANPFLFISWVKYSNKQYDKGYSYSIISLIFTLSFLLYQRLPEGSAGNHTFTIGSGYYVWLLSIVLCLVANHQEDKLAFEERINKYNKNT